jgi:hypothetical protein
LRGRGKRRTEAGSFGYTEDEYPISNKEYPTPKGGQAGSEK